MQLDTGEFNRHFYIEGEHLVNTVSLWVAIARKVKDHGEDVSLFD